MIARSLTIEGPELTNSEDLPEGVVAHPDKNTTRTDNRVQNNKLTFTPAL